MTGMDRPKLVFELREVLISLFQSMLRRTPAEHEIVRLAEQARAGVPLSTIVQGFVRSAEFKRHIVGAIGQLDCLPSATINLDLTAAERQSLWHHVAHVWSRMGIDDPYWSVITIDDYRIANMSSTDRIEQFYDSGRHEVERLESYLARNGRPFPDKEVCVDYGCGVGRVTLWLARRCRAVLAIDVSEAHLGLARRNLSARGVTNVEFLLLRDIEDLKILDRMKLFHSLMALQHNPPPLIVEILSVVFNSLASGGCAFFQVPTFAKDYVWDYTTYARRTMPEERMELHMLPQSKVFDLAASAGCLPLEVQPDGYVKVGVPHWISNTFLFAKCAADSR